jgi:microcystin-dependent protein
MEPFIGQIIMFAGNFAPQGWAFCDGQLLSIAQNTALFSILGTTYGGNGQTTFGLPDLRGRVPIHPGQGPGLSSYALGQQAGTETVTLTVQQIPQHTHAFTPGCSTDPPNSNSPSNAVPAPPEGIQAYNTEANASMRPGNSSSVGGSQPHDNLQPYNCVNFIIALQGIFPSRG